MEKKKFFVFFLIILFLSLTLVGFSNTTVGRYLRFGPKSVNHYKVFQYREISSEQPYFKFGETNLESIVKSRFSEVEYGNNQKIGDLDNFLEMTGTTSFIVIYKDNIIFEKYYNNYNRESIVTSFSMANSFTSALIGIAIEEGHIKSVYDSITDYLPELKERDPRFNEIRIIDLLHMSSGLKYEETFDDINAYYSPNLRRLALEKTKILEMPDTRFLHNNYNSLLLGIIIERATGKTVSEYLEEKIWKSIGMEFEGSWSIDAYDFEKMESGINCRAIDFAKFGRLYLNKGNWNEKQIISTGWAVASTAPYLPENNNYYPTKLIFYGHPGYYSLMWWGIKRDDKNYDFYTSGNHGQYIYVSPEKDLIIVRNGISYGKDMKNNNEDWWPVIFYQFADQFPSN
jgi:CubicO group peptidase (beta-lactamase class C family)